MCLTYAQEKEATALVPVEPFLASLFFAVLPHIK